LGGLAQVVALKDYWTTRQLSNQITPELSCYDGAVRIYWPGFTRQSDMRQHPLFLRKKLEEFPIVNWARERLVVDHIHRAAALAHGEGPIARQARQAASQEALARFEKEHDFMGLRQAYEKAAAECDNLQAQLETATEQLVNLQRAWFEETAPEPLAPAPVHVDPKAFRTADEVVAASEKVHPRLIYWSNARRASKGLMTRHLGDLWLALGLLDELADAYYRDRSLGMSLPDWLKEAAQRRGQVLPKFSMKESDTNASKFATERTFTLEGRRQQMEKHFTLGRADPEGCMHVFWEFNDARKAIDVGYVGLHLSYSKDA
jgi:hypothetical protein